MTTALTLLAYRSVLDSNQDKMIDYIREHHPWAPAQEMVTHLWDRLTARLVEDYPHKNVDAAMADRIMNEALGFLWLCSTESGHGPSPLVDLGWHTFILYTIEYEAFSHVLAGEMMHHLPTDLPSSRAGKGTRAECNIGDNCKCGKGGDGQDGRTAEDSAKCSDRCANCTKGCDGYSETALSQLPDGNCLTRCDEHKGKCKMPATRPMTLRDTVRALALLGPVDMPLWTGPCDCTRLDAKCKVCSSCKGGGSRRRCLTATAS